MQNIKYHSINILVVIVFSLVSAKAVNAVIKQSLVSNNNIDSIKKSNKITMKTKNY